jgi:hypothetical protein
MVRVCRRIAVAVFAVTLVVCLLDCKKPAPGGACTSNGKFVCTSATGGLICQNGTLQTLPCRGPRGCQGVGAAAQCDDDLAQAGDACQQTLNENYSCSTDHASELVCKDGKFVVARTCKGLKKCSINGDLISCDDSLADVGDACVVEPGDANYACSSDKKTEVVCDAASAKFVATDSCRGSKGCWIDRDFVRCDSSFAREGDICRHVDGHACAEDAKSELKCNPQGKWQHQHDCKREGCKVKGNEIWCD